MSATKPIDFGLSEEELTSPFTQLEGNSLQTLNITIWHGHCAPIWDPFHHKLIYQLEMIQHRAACFLLNQPWIMSCYDNITEML